MHACESRAPGAEERLVGPGERRWLDAAIIGWHSGFGDGDGKEQGAV
jgi:hypothetical protein